MVRLIHHDLWECYSNRGVMTSNRGLQILLRLVWSRGQVSWAGRPRLWCLFWLLPPSLCPISSLLVPIPPASIFASPSLPCFRLFLPFLKGEEIENKAENKLFTPASASIGQKCNFCEPVISLFRTIHVAWNVGGEISGNSKESSMACIMQTVFTSTVYSLNCYLSSIIIYCHFPFSFISTCYNYGWECSGQTNLNLYPR